MCSTFLPDLDKALCPQKLRQSETSDSIHFHRESKLTEQEATEVVLYQTRQHPRRYQREPPYCVVVCGVDEVEARSLIG